jgi:AAA domain, putative AbiEii toxin, Type IV TA system
MLLSVNIANFRSCRDVDLGDVNEILALIGRNGVGKTNILKAVEWAARVGSAAAQLDPSKVSFRSGSVTLRVLLEGQIFRYAVTLEIDPDGRKQAGIQHYLVEELVREDGGDKVTPIFSRHKGDLTVGSDGTELKVSALSPAVQSILSLVPEHPVVPLLDSFTQFLGAVHYYPIEEIETDSAIDVVPHKDYEGWLGAQSSPGDANRGLVLKLLDLWLNRRVVFDELLSILGSDGLDVLADIHISSVEIPSGIVDSIESPEKLKTAKSKYYFIEFSPSGHPEGREFSFASLSFGTRRVVRLLTALLYDGATVSLIEQPEDGIHTGLLHKLIPILRSYANPGQFLVTSHSSEVLNRVLPKEIRLVDLKDGITSVRELNGVEIEAARKFMENDGPLAEFIESVQEL